MFNFQLFPGSNLFGRSQKIQALNEAFRSSGVHPNLVPDAVLVTIIKLLKNYKNHPGNKDFSLITDFLAYLMLGKDSYCYADDSKKFKIIENRLETSLARGEGLDSELVLLALHAAIIHPDVKKEFTISSH